MTEGKVKGTIDAIVEAALHADWTQVVLNGGPPCFSYEPRDGKPYFCLRAERWEGHWISGFHRFVSLAELLASTNSGDEKP